VLRLTSAQGCVAPSRITVRAAPPAGVELELLRVAIEGRLATRMAGVRGARQHHRGHPARLEPRPRDPCGRSAARRSTPTSNSSRLQAGPSRPEPPVSEPISRGGGED
jgi:hypothetical protein